MSIYWLFCGLLFAVTLVDGKHSNKYETSNDVSAFLKHEQELGFTERQVVERIKNDTNIAKRLVSSKLVSDPKGGHKRVIMIGTKWCGHGNVAKNDEDRGYLSNLDSCCKVHDQCPLNIVAGKEKWGVKNTADHTVSDCKCDDTFSKCLQKVNGYIEGPLSNFVGYLFFNKLNIKCVIVPPVITSNEEEPADETDASSASGSAEQVAELREPEKYTPGSNPFRDAFNKIFGKKK